MVKYCYLVFSLDLKLPILCSSDNIRPCVALFSSLSEASQYATLLPALHSSTSSFSSKTEHLLQIGILHLKHSYFMSMKHEQHISIMLWSHSMIPHPSRIRVCKNFSRDLLGQGHCKDTWPREEVRATSKVLMFYLHYFTIPTKLLEQEGINPLCQVVVVIFRLQSKDLFRTQKKCIQDGCTTKHMAPNM